MLKLFEIKFLVISVIIANIKIIVVVIAITAISISIIASFDFHSCEASVSS